MCNERIAKERCVSERESEQDSDLPVCEEEKIYRERCCESYESPRK